MSINCELFNFIKSAPTSYHAVDTVANMLIIEGFTELYENEVWKLECGKGYFVRRNGSSIIAFKNRSGGFMITASHSDSPAFRLKASLEKSGVYARLDTEKYGGMINYTWLDKPLSLAGRVSVRTEDGVEERLFDFGAPFAVIPSLAIHMNKTVNESAKFNPAQDLLPLVAMQSGTVSEKMAEKLGVGTTDVLGHDLFLYNFESGVTFGSASEFILAPRLDDLQCVFSATKAFLCAADSFATPVLAVFDNEEVGSETKQGAASTFLYDTLKRISGGEGEYLCRIADSFMVSMDNAHAIHPAHPELADATNAPKLNSGIVIKYNSNQRYATDGYSEAIFKAICERAGVRTQSYYNRADMPGGSTLGSISNTKVSVPTVDIGIPQLAMHSATETAGAFDTEEMVKAIKAFYSSKIERKGTKTTIA